jgi:hypothetical protein
MRANGVGAPLEPHQQPLPRAANPEATVMLSIWKWGQVGKDEQVGRLNLHFA